MPKDEKVEEKSVSLDEAKQGVHLSPGHKTVLIVDIPRPAGAGTGGTGAGGAQAPGGS